MASNKKLSLTKTSEIKVSAFLDTTDPDNLIILTDDQESTLDQNNLPENITKLESTWVKPNWAHQQLIDANSYVERMIGGKIQRFFDSGALTQAHVRVLLKSWNLHELDAALTLEFEDAVENRELKILTEKTMHKIGNLQPPTILVSMYNKMFQKLFMGGTDSKNLKASPVEVTQA